MPRFQSAENFTKEMYRDKKAIDGLSPHHAHLNSVVTRLKNLGISDNDTISAAWLHDIMEYTSTSFDEIDQRFGSKTAVLVLSISKDRGLPKAVQDEQYVKQLKDAPLNAKIIKLCDISANFKDLKSAPFSEKKKTKEMRKNLHHLNALKLDLIENKSQFPGITSLISGINDIAVSHRLRPLMI